MRREKLSSGPPSPSAPARQGSQPRRSEAETGRASPPRMARSSGLFILALCLVCLLSLLFLPSFKPGQALFSNDGPLGLHASRPYELPAAFSGIWNDHDWLGAYGGNYSPNLTRFIFLLFTPLGRLNFYAPLSLLTLGLCAWVFFRQLGFSAWVCVLGGIAAALNMNFLSNACWGLGSRAVCTGMIFLALAALQSSFQSSALIKTALAGLAVGLGITEAGDYGAIFSFFVAAYGLYGTFLEEGGFWQKLWRGIRRVALMTVLAAVMAAEVFNVFVETNYIGVVGMKQDAQSKEERWDWATEWSLPKIETLRVLVPGLFGYRMDTAGGGQYWGRVGQTPGWQEGGGGTPRFSGSGEYAGLLVMLLAVFAIAESFRGGRSVFAVREQRLVWFWGEAAAVSLILAWGRHAPAYQFIYQLPFFSTIRNPIKFMHPFHLVILILFAYGLEAVRRRYFSQVTANRGPNPDGKSWWTKASHFEKRWIVSGSIVFAMSLAAAVVYYGAKSALADYLAGVGFDATAAARIASFSSREASLFVLFLALVIGCLTLVQSGVWARSRAKWAVTFAALFLAIDLGRAALPWITYYNYREMYASNPVFAILKTNPHLARVVMASGQKDGSANLLREVFETQWLQHQFQYYNIQCLNVIQEPRVATDKAAYQRAFPDFMRYLRLTNTRYVLGMAADAVQLPQAPPNPDSLKPLLFFDLAAAPGSQGVSVQTNTSGPFALMEYENALPRATLYGNWESVTNEQEVLSKLADPAFDPAKAVLVSGPVAAPTGGVSENGADTVQFVSYAPKLIEQKAHARNPAILLLNDRFHPYWKASVDGKPAKVLRCNFVMRGIYLEPGEHLVRWQFEPPRTAFYVSLAAVLTGLVLCGYLLWRPKRGERIGPASVGWLARFL